MAISQFPRFCTSAVRRGLPSIWSAVLVTFLALISACTGDVKVVVVTSSLTAGTKTRFAYVANRTDDTLSIFVVDTEFDQNGDKVQLRHNGYVRTGAEPNSVATDPSGSFVFVANSGDDNLSGFSIDSDTGRLTEIAGSPFTTGATPSSVAVSPSGTFVFVANSGDNTVSVFSVDISTGVLSEVMNSPFATGLNPTAVTSSVGDGLIFVANTGDNTVSSFSFDPSVGELQEVTGSPFATGSGPSSITVNTTGSIAYVTNFLSSTVSAFAVSNNGQLSELASSPYMTQSGPFSATITASGSFAYVTNFNSNSVTAFAVQGDGSLIEIIGSPFATGVQPISIALDLGGCSAVVVNSGENSLSEYTIDTLSGELFFDRDMLARAGPASVAMAAGTKSVEFIPTFLYSANQGSDEVSGYSIDPLDGELTELANSPFVAGDLAFEIALDPLGEFVYVPNLGDDTISVYRIEDDGNLVELAGLPFGSGSPVSVGNGPESIAVDPSARFIYVNSPADNAIRGFSVDRASGALTPMSMPFPVTSPEGLRVDPSGRFLYAVSNNVNVAVFSIDTTSGELTAAGVFGVLSSGELLDISPCGGTLYVTDGSQISAHSIDPVDGSLTTIAGSPFAIGFSSFDIVVDPTGTFAYVSDISGQAAILVSRDQTTGALSILDSEGLGSSPTGVAIDISGRFAYFQNFGNDNLQEFAVLKDFNMMAFDLLELMGSPVSTADSPRDLAATGIIR